MIPAAGLADAAARARVLFARKPAAALTTKHAVANWCGDGARTQVRMQGHTLIADQPPALGGRDEGPNPGDLLRGALAACLAQHLVMHGPRFGVVIREVEVSVETDIDLRAVTGLFADMPLGFTEIRYTVTVVTDAESAKVQALMDYAERSNPTLDDLRRNLTLKGQLEVIGTR